MIITETPTRISFLGGGTDYPKYFLAHGGAVLGTAIDKFALLSINRFYSELFDYNIRISYRNVETVDDLEKIKHAPFRECLRWCGLTHDIEVNYSAELPAFTGLGSSSTFVVGLLNTLYAYKGMRVPPLELAYQAIDLERNVLNESVGCQDQVFAAMGGFNLIEFREMDHIIVNRVPMSKERMKEFESHLMIFFTGIKRRAEDLVVRQVSNFDIKMKHLHSLRKLVDQGLNVLVNSGNIEKFGELLHKAWKEKRELDEDISNRTIDEIYSRGLEAGALGGKVLGAGGGGFVLLFTPPDKQFRVREYLNDYTEIPVQVNASGSRVVHA